MSLIRHNPKSVALAGRYSLGVEVPPDARLLFVSGQVGVDGKGKTLAGIDKQCDQAWKNIGAVLRSGGMKYSDIVKLTVFLTDPRYIAAFRTSRDRFITATDPVPASTLLIVAGLAAPEMLVEIEAVAARS